MSVALTAEGPRLVARAQDVGLALRLFGGVAIWLRGTDWSAEVCAQATLDDLDESALIEILTKPKNALVKQYGRLFEMEGVKLNFTEDALRVVAARAIQRKTGARGLRSIMEQIFINTMFDLPGLDGVEEVVINGEIAERRANPLFLYGKERAEAGS
jgi:ATP-dependent Clp protease ATP-binding subunit ClpX